MTRDFQYPLLPIPINEQQWRKQRQPQQALVIEIGAGVGLHPIQYGLAHPNSMIVAIEKTSEKYQKMQRRLQHHHLDNVYPVQANAIQWVSQNLHEEEVDDYFILYPNPYPKASQRNKRFINIPFMQKLWQTLKIGGHLTLATNEDFYYLEAVETWQTLPFLEVIEIGRVPCDVKPRTHFEKKYLERGEQCWHCVVKKTVSVC